MNFPFNVYAAALLGGLAVSFGSAIFWKSWCERRGFIDLPGDRKIHDRTVPLAGGLAILTGIAVPVILGGLTLFYTDLFAEARGVLRYGFEKRIGQLSAIGLGAAGLLLVGLLDDKYELKPGLKFLLQASVALLVAASGVRITLFVSNLLFSYLATIFWILLVVNSFNFMDNMNGLCAGIAALAAGYFGLDAAWAGQYLVSLFCFLVLGATLGFLPHNFPRGQSFLGDSGSHLLGFLVATLAILPHFYTPDSSRQGLVVLTPLLVLAVPLADLLSVVIWRTWNRKPF